MQLLKFDRGFEVLNQQASNVVTPLRICVKKIYNFSRYLLDSLPFDQTKTRQTTQIIKHPTVNFIISSEEVIY
jgi:hypothetical protein